MKIENKEIYKIVSCNKTFYAIWKNGNRMPSNVAFDIYHNINVFNEVEQFVFDIMTNTFGEELDINNMTEDQKSFYNGVMNTQISIDDVRPLSRDFIENNNIADLSIEDVENLQIILK